MASRGAIWATAAVVSGASILGVGALTDWYFAWGWYAGAFAIMTAAVGAGVVEKVEQADARDALQEMNERERQRQD